MLVCKDAVFGETIASLENKYHLQKIISLAGFINDEPIDATKAQETFEALRIKKHLFVGDKWCRCIRYRFVPLAFYGLTKWQKLLSNGE